MTTPHYRTLLTHCQEGDHLACPHQYAFGIKLGRNPVQLARLCSCDCHKDCPLWPAEEVPQDEWVEGCSCPGSPPFKEIVRNTHAESENRKAERSAAINEVVEAGPKDRDQTVQALRAAYRRHGLELTSRDEDYLPEIVQARLAPRSQKNVLTLKALGRMGLSVFRAFRELRTDEELDGEGPQDDP